MHLLISLIITTVIFFICRYFEKLYLNNKKHSECKMKNRFPYSLEKLNLMKESYDRYLDLMGVERKRKVSIFNKNSQEFNICYIWTDNNNLNLVLSENEIVTILGKYNTVISDESKYEELFSYMFSKMVKIPLKNLLYYKYDKLFRKADSIYLYYQNDECDVGCLQFNNSKDLNEYNNNLSISDILNELFHQKDKREYD